jgi:hypothetical protein
MFLGMPFTKRKNLQKKNMKLYTAASIVIELLQLNMAVGFMRNRVKGWIQKRKGLVIAVEEAVIILQNVMHLATSKGIPSTSPKQSPATSYTPSNPPP